MVGHEELNKLINEVSEIAESFGLDPYNMRYQICPQKIINTLSAYYIPTRYSHWSFGSEVQKRIFDYNLGLEKIFELVVNTNPTYAFLLEGNSLIQNKIIVAHVIAHSDFFKNNIHFKNTPKNILQIMKRNAEKITYYEKRHGKTNVENFLNSVLTIQEQVKNGSEVHADLLLYIQKFSNVLTDWQKDIIKIIREEMQYFSPQVDTKLMNEGWATYWHMRILREMNLTEAEIFEYAKFHSSIIKPTNKNLNPYLVGLRIFEEIEQKWDNIESSGRKKIFEVRKLENDISFLRKYITKDIIERLDIYVYQKKGNRWEIIEKDWEKVRNQILKLYFNGGIPGIYIENNISANSDTLYLKHLYDGIELDIYNLEKVLQDIYKLWGETVYLETIIEDKRAIFSCNGKSNSRKFL